MKTYWVTSPPPAPSTSKKSGTRARYVCLQELYDAAKTGKKQVWLYNGKLRTVRVGNDYLKAEFAPPDQLETLKAEFGACGGRGLPSSWGDVYHRLFKSPFVPRSVAYETKNRVLAGWQQAKRGNYEGDWHVHDIVSAYAWAAMRDLPWIRSARPDRSGNSKSGIYVVTFARAGSICPPHIRPGAPVLLSGEEIRRYDLQGVEVERGVEFRRFCNITDNLIFIKDRFTNFKKVWRAFWGSWIASGPVTCQILEDGRVSKTWNAERPTFNAPWASIITGRIRLRVADHAEKAAHVFVDSVMVPYRIPGGTSCGDWAYVRTVTAPRIFGAGKYADGKGEILKHSGMSFTKGKAIGL